MRDQVYKNYGFFALIRFMRKKKHSSVVQSCIVFEREMTKRKTDSSSDSFSEDSSLDEKRIKTELQSIDTVRFRIRYSNGMTSSLDLDKATQVYSLLEMLVCLRALEDTGLDGLSNASASLTRSSRLHINAPARCLSPHETLGEISRQFCTDRLTVYCFE